MNREIEYWVAASAIPGVGTATFSYLLKHFKTLKKFWLAEESSINKLKIPQKTKESVLDFRKKVEPKVYLDKVYSLGIRCISLADRDYPANLKTIAGAPPVLYMKGQLLPQDDLAIAVVGSRNATFYGRQVTEKFIFDLVKNGLTIVSGLARGIDTTAHKTALEAGGRTIALLGCGLDMVYPPENKKLAEEIVKNGAVISEFPLGFPAVQSNFAARNRIISGMSLGVFVPEAAVDSGSMITAGYAAEQGREVFAVPGPITSKFSEGVNNLIKEGVHPVTSVDDILQVLDIERRSKHVAGDKQQVVKVKDPDQQKILELLNGETKHIDLIAREVKMPIEKVSATLSMMEISGFVKNFGSGIWGK